MRTNIVIDEQLIAEVMKAYGYKTKKEAVDRGLRLLAQRARQRDIRKLRGKVRWEGNLDEMRGGQ